MTFGCQKENGYQFHTQIYVLIMHEVEVFLYNRYKSHLVIELKLKLIYATYAPNLPENNNISTLVRSPALENQLCPYD